MGLCQERNCGSRVIEVLPAENEMTQDEVESKPMGPPLNLVILLQLAAVDEFSV